MKSDMVILFGTLAIVAAILFAGAWQLAQVELQAISDAIAILR